MDVSSLSIEMSLSRVQEDAAISMTARGLDAMKAEGAGVVKLLESGAPVTDPALGQRLNITA